jgi:hypothetical protein
MNSQLKVILIVFSGYKQNYFSWFLDEKVKEIISAHFFRIPFRYYVIKFVSDLRQVGGFLLQ